MTWSHNHSPSPASIPYSYRDRPCAAISAFSENEVGWVCSRRNAAQAGVRRLRQTAQAHVRPVVSTRESRELSAFICLCPTERGLNFVGRSAYDKGPTVGTPLRQTMRLVNAETPVAGATSQPIEVTRRVPVLIHWSTWTKMIAKACSPVNYERENATIRNKANKTKRSLFSGKLTSLS